MSRIAIARLGACVAAAWLASASVARATPAVPDVPAWSLLPQPVLARPAGGGAFALADGATVAVRGADRDALRSIAERLVQRLTDTRGLRLRMATAGTAHPALPSEASKG